MRCVRGGLMACLMMLIGVTALAEVYRWVDAEGKVHFGDTPPPGVAAQELALPAPPPAAPATKAPASKSASKLPAAAAAPSPAAAPNVEIFVTDWCPYCRKAENWFRARNIPFRAYDVEKDAGAAARKARISQARGVPLVLICDQQIPGYSEQAFEQALQACR